MRSVSQFVRRVLTLFLLPGLLAVPLAMGQAAPGSVRAELTGTAVRLTWEAGASPYGIYRSSSPDRIVDKANYVGVTAETTFDDALELEPGGAILYFVVDESPRCNGQFTCDNGNGCDGTEFCGVRCAPGEPVKCNDGNSCTEDICVLATGACNSTTLDCNDGDPCTLDVCLDSIGCDYQVDPAAGVGTPAELAGNSLALYPHF